MTNIIWVLITCSPFLVRLTVVAGCKMELQNFPMDKQECGIHLESCKYDHTFRISYPQPNERTVLRARTCKKSVTRPSFWAAGQKDKTHNKRWVTNAPPQSSSIHFVSYFWVFQIFVYRCITNFDILFLVIGFIYLLGDSYIYANYQHPFLNKIDSLSFCKYR